MNIVRKLRRKFILISTAIVIIIVAGSISLLYVITDMRMNNQISLVLSYISQNEGNISQKQLPSDYNYNWFYDTNWSDDTPDFSYQIRFFTVLTNSQGYVKEVNVKNIAAFTEKEAIQYAQTSVNEKKAVGFFKKDRASYAYMITRTSNNDILIVILDCTRDIAFVHDFLSDSAMFGFICILLYVLILAVLSKLAIKPFVRNIENQKRFITNAGHELKTPLTIISANTEALEIITGKNQWTENILKQIHRLSNLINHLIMLSKMREHSRLSLTLTNVNLSDTVNDIIKSFKSMAEEDNKHLYNNIEPNIFIKSDSKYIYELINILADNAIKYCDENGSIDFTLVQKKKNIILSISNSYKAGKDIDYTRFFERFYRGDTSHNSEKAGYGIGLSIAEELTALLKGSISVSYADEKITFSIKF